MLWIILGLFGICCAAWGFAMWMHPKTKRKTAAPAPLLVPEPPKPEPGSTFDQMVQAHRNAIATVGAAWSDLQVARKNVEYAEDALETAIRRRDDLGASIRKATGTDADSLSGPTGCPSWWELSQIKRARKTHA